MTADLLVVGLNLVTGREVHAGDGRTEEWYKKGHNGDRTLVCLACYEGADLPDGPRTVALVPKGRDGGARQQHFAHPPGMVPPGGKHSPESLWHAEGKQAIREWAGAHGFAARVEAWTADGRRRSDVEVILPGGHRLAIELQRGELSDAEWIARHEDYVRAGITDLWLYHPDTRAPRVIFRHRQPGWRFDLGARTLGLVHAQPSRADAWASPHPTQCRVVHWPPCPADQLATKWMPLASARLTPDGIKPSAQTTAELDRLAAIAARELAAEQAWAEAAARDRDERNHAVVLRSTAGKVDAPSDGGQLPETHEAFRWDAFPPEAYPDTWCFGCDICGLELTGAMLKVSPVVHVIRTMERTRARTLLSELQDLTLQIIETGSTREPSTPAEPEPHAPENVGEARLTCGQPSSKIPFAQASPKRDLFQARASGPVLTHFRLSGELARDSLSLQTVSAGPRPGLCPSLLIIVLQ